jgi:hypothetical protein
MKLACPFRPARFAKIPPIFKVTLPAVAGEPRFEQGLYLKQTDRH